MFGFDPVAAGKLAGHQFAVDKVTHFLEAQLMGQLKASPRFTNVTFSYTRQAQIGQKTVAEFEIVCQAVLKEGAKL